MDYWHISGRHHELLCVSMKHEESMAVLITVVY